VNKVVLSAVVPLVSLALIAIFAITLGYSFYQVHHNTEIGTIGVIGIGLALLILTPIIAFFLVRSSEK
jgi:multisubunit Na+/H+ antiporter MnhG subunit